MPKMSRTGEAFTLIDKINEEVRTATLIFIS